MSKYTEIEDIFSTLSDLNHLQAIAGWDEAVMMPAGGGTARAKALATLSGLHHQMLTQKELGTLIKAAKQETLETPWQAENLKLIEKQYINATCLSEKLVHQLTTARLECEQAWRTLRAENNWHAFTPKLERVLNLVKESADIRSQKLGMSPYDVLIDEYSPGLSQAIIDPIFDRLKAELPPLVKQILEKQKTFNVLPLKGNYPIETQKKLGLELMRAIGFDFNRGRLDVSHHPFCGGVAEDVRITTRYNTDEFISASMGICHETGHACYEQGLPQDWLSQPVGMAYGMTMHESQSLLIEMQACRTREFIQHFSHLAQQHFGKDTALEADNLYHLVTKVEPGLIRVDADEVTYPLHVILRYELEKELIEGSMMVSDLPDAWNEKMLTYFNLSTLNNDKNGVMQDVHWPSAGFGYFPSYTLGRLIAAQLFMKAQQQHPNIITNLAEGNFTVLMKWLHTHIFSKGSSRSTEALLLESTGQALNPDYFIEHIKRKYL